MNRMDTLTLRYTAIWAVIAGVLLGADHLIRKYRRQRREDREWAAGVAQRMQRRGAPPFLTDKEEAAFAAIVANYNKVPLDEILDSEGED